MITKFARVFVLLGLGAMLSTGLVACGGDAAAPDAPAEEAPAAAPAE